MLCCLFYFLACFCWIPALALYFRIKKFSKKSKTISIAFFHPFCNDGGGGERVLWCAIKGLEKQYSTKVECYIYSGENKSSQEILSCVKRQFDITFSNKINFIDIKSRPLLNPSLYPAFTLLGQTIGGLFCALECLLKFQPDIFIDTTGHAVTFPVFKLLGGSNVACYVHYPTISTDMLGVVRDGSSAHNNNKSIASSPLKTKAKLIYYELFAKLYGYLGYFSDVVMVNSSWTGDHISQLWGGSVVKVLKNQEKEHSSSSKENKKSIYIVYPPCNTTTLQSLNLSPRQPKILSIGQFRPEKNHALQLQAFSLLLKKHPSLLLNVRLVLLGSSRNENDQNRVEKLKSLANELGISSHVEFCINAKFSVLLEHLQSATVGIHTMWNEHFGIGIVEFMAAGVIPVAHNSAGPKLDIVRNIDGGKTGYLATTAEEYAESIWTLLDLSQKELTEIQKRARRQSQQFSDESFTFAFLKSLSQFFTKIK
eukprot:c12561_g1_i2.p1 GENE.c12561_g1_i2~~c12561_g1_i2.p1  ORF type:complete len:482 (+),score=157.99 c12561_g1_i2:26-1471(+)